MNDTPLTQELDAAWRELEADALASDGPIRDRDVREAIQRNRARIEAAAARRAIEGSGVVRTVQAKRPPSGVDSHMAGWVRWDKPMDPITRLLADLDYESYEVDAVGGGKVRCWKFSEWPDTLRRAVETVRAALSRPEEPRVERCAWCGTPVAAHPLTDACAIAQESEVR